MSARRRARGKSERARGERWLNTVRTIIVCTTNCEIYDSGRAKRSSRRRAGEEQDGLNTERGAAMAGDWRHRSIHPLMDVL